MDRTEGIGASSVVHAEDMQTDAANLEEESENLQAILENKADIHHIGFPLNSEGIVALRLFAVSWSWILAVSRRFTQL